MCLQICLLRPCTQEAMSHLPKARSCRAMAGQWGPVSVSFQMASVSFYPAPNSYKYSCCPDSGTTTPPGLLPVGEVNRQQPFVERVLFTGYHAGPFHVISGLQTNPPRELGAYLDYG